MVLTIGNSHKKGAWWRVIGWRNKAVEGPAGQSYYSRIAEIVSLSAREAVIAHCVLNARNVAREPPAETWREPIPFWLEVSRQSGANRLPRQLASFHRSQRRGSIVCASPRGRASRRSRTPNHCVPLSAKVLEHLL